MVNPANLIRVTCQDLLNGLSEIKGIDKNTRDSLNEKIQGIFEQSKQPAEVATLKQHFDLQSLEDKPDAEFFLACRIITEVTSEMDNEQTTFVTPLINNLFKKIVQFSDDTKPEEGVSTHRQRETKGSLQTSDGLIRKTCQDLLEGLPKTMERLDEREDNTEKLLKRGIEKIFAESQKPDKLDALKKQLSLQGFEGLSKSDAEVYIAGRIIDEITDGMSTTQIGLANSLVSDLQKKLKRKVEFSDDIKKTAQRTFEELAEENSGRISWENMGNAFQNYATSAKGLAVDKDLSKHLKEIFLETLEECKLGNIKPVGFQARFMEKIKAQNIKEEDRGPAVFKSMYERKRIVQDSESKRLYDMANSGKWSDGDKTVKVFRMTDTQIEGLQEKSSELFKSESFQKCLKIFREQR